MVGSASSYYGVNREDASISFYYLVRQILFAGAGLLVMYRLMKTDYHFFARREVALGLLAGTTGLLLLVFLFSPHKGTHRWIPMGLFGIQPSEIAKLAIAVFLAYMIERKGPAINVFAVGTVPCIGVAALLAGLVLFEPDMGDVRPHHAGRDARPFRRRSALALRRRRGSGGRDAPSRADPDGPLPRAAHARVPPSGARPAGPELPALPVEDRARERRRSRKRPRVRPAEVALPPRVAHGLHLLG
jgi:hypothetical protein